MDIFKMNSFTVYFQSHFVINASVVAPVECRSVRWGAAVTRASTILETLQFLSGPALIISRVTNKKVTFERWSRPTGEIIGSDTERRQVVFTALSLRIETRKVWDTGVDKETSGSFCGNIVASGAVVL